MNDPESSRAMARGLSAVDLDPDAREAVVDSYTAAETEADLSPEAVEVLEAGREVISTVETIREAMQPIKAKVVLWRAAELGEFPSGPAEMVGETFTVPSYVWCTTDRSTVQVSEGGWLMAVVVPEGTRAVWLAEARELMIDQGTRFRVVSFNGDVVKVVAVPPAS